MLTVPLMVTGTTPAQMSLAVAPGSVNAPPSSTKIGLPPFNVIAAEACRDRNDRVAALPAVKIGDADGDNVIRQMQIGEGKPVFVAPVTGVPSRLH